MKDVWLNEYLNYSSVPSCRFLVSKLYSVGLYTIEVLNHVSEKSAKNLDTLTSIRDYVYSQNTDLIRFIKYLDEDEIIEVVDATWTYVENFGDCICYLKVKVVSIPKIIKLTESFAHLSFLNKYGQVKQIKLMEKLLADRYQEYQNASFVLEVNSNEFDKLSSYFDPLVGAEKLASDGYINFSTAYIQFPVIEDGDEYGIHYTGTDNGYSCMLYIKILPKLLHKWAVESSIDFSKLLSFDIKTGVMWIDDCNYVFFRKQLNPSKVAKIWKCMVDHVNTFVSYRELAMSVYDWDEKTVEKLYIPTKKDDIRKDLQDLREEIEKVINSNELSDIFSIEANKGFRLNFIPLNI